MVIRAATSMRRKESYWYHFKCDGKCQIIVAQYHMNIISNACYKVDIEKYIFFIGFSKIVNCASLLFWKIYSISQEICTRFLLCCALLWLYIDWFFPYPSGLLHWHCGNLTIAPVPAKQPWWIWINTSCEFIMNDCITTTKQSTTKPCAYFLGYTV